MSQYKIERFDVVMFGNSTTKVPMLYIKPDLTFLEFARSNNYAVSVEINGTGTIYDGKIIPGVVDKSCYVPNCRPNFYEKTGYYVITLWSNWYGYLEPDKLGTVKFFGMKAPISDSYTHYGPPQKTEAYKVKNAIKQKTTGMDSKELLLISGLVVVIVLVMIQIVKVVKK